MSDDNLTLSQIRRLNEENDTAIIYASPVAKPRMTQSDRWKKRPAVLKYFAFKDVVRSMLPFGYILPDKPRIVFLIPMPKSWSKKKRKAMDETPHRSRPDIDNFIKGLFDAIYEEDCQIWFIWAEAYWTDSGTGIIHISSAE